MEPIIIGYIVFFVCFVAGIAGYFITSRLFKNLRDTYENPEALAPVYGK